MGKFQDTKSMLDFPYIYPGSPTPENEDLASSVVLFKEEDEGNGEEHLYLSIALFLSLQERANKRGRKSVPWLHLLNLSQEGGRGGGRRVRGQGGRGNRIPLGLAVLTKHSGDFLYNGPNSKATSAVHLMTQYLLMNDKC